jgi:hypothetical protein
MSLPGLVPIAVFGVNGVLASVRERFGKNRKSGARKLKGVEAGDLRVLRDLQKRVG